MPGIYLFNKPSSIAEGLLRYPFQLILYNLLRNVYNLLYYLSTLVLLASWRSSSLNFVFCSQLCLDICLLLEDLFGVKLCIFFQIQTKNSCSRQTKPTYFLLIRIMCLRVLQVSISEDYVLFAMAVNLLCGCNAVIASQGHIGISKIMDRHPSQLMT